jgi:hypothetical protein
MKNAKGNLFDQVADAIVITTNGFVKTNGECVMGKGCAAEAKAKWPMIPLKLGGLINKHGNRVLAIGKTSSYSIVAFPVKSVAEMFNGSNVVAHMASKFSSGDQVPGWACKARLSIIERSALQLVELADKRGWNSVILPRPGCGAGELAWTEVEPLLQGILDDRFSAITF